MSNCEHRNYIRGRVTKEYLGGTFRADGTRCKDCDAALWDNDMQSKFRDWLGKHYKKARSRFILHPVLSPKVRESLCEIQKLYPGQTEASIIRALVALYLQVVAKDPELTAIIEMTVDSKNYKLLTRDATTATSVTFKPAAMESILAWSKITGFAPSKVVEEALHRQLACYLAVTDEGQRIWASIKDQFTMILMAA